MELIIGMALGASLGYLVSCCAIKQEDSRQEAAPHRQEAEPLEEQWQRIFDYEGYQSLREDEDA